MTFTTWKLEQFNELQGGVPDNEIVDFSNPQIITSMGDGRDSFSFELKTDSAAASFLGIRDKIKISRTVDGASFTGFDVVMVGAVNKLPRDITGSSAKLRVKGNNFSKTLMDAAVFIDATQLTIPQALEEALNSIANYSQGFGVTWNSNNPSVQSDGSAFPDVGETWYYKSMRELLEEYSQNAQTEDGDYYWYVDTDNTLVWRREEVSIVDSISDGFPYKSIDLKRDSEEVINFVRAKGDTLPTGGAVEAQYIDFGSAGKHGLRYDVIQNKSKLVATNHNAVMTNLGAADEDVLPSDISGFSYPLPLSQLTWTETDTISNDADYLNSLKTFVKGELRKQAEEHVVQNKDGYFEIEMEVLASDNAFNLGELYDFQLNIQGFPQKPMRVVEIQYTNIIDVIRFREDEPSV